MVHASFQKLFISSFISWLLPLNTVGSLNQTFQHAFCLLHSPLLQASLLVSFSPLTYMLKFCGPFDLSSNHLLNAQAMIQPHVINLIESKLMVLKHLSEPHTTDTHWVQTQNFRKLGWQIGAESNLLTGDSASIIYIKISVDSRGSTTRNAQHILLCPSSVSKLRHSSLSNIEFKYKHTTDTKTAGGTQAS